MHVLPTRSPSRPRPAMRLSALLRRERCRSRGWRRRRSTTRTTSSVSLDDVEGGRAPLLSCGSRATTSSFSSGAANFRTRARACRRRSTRRKRRSRRPTSSSGTRLARGNGDAPSRPVRGESPRIRTRAGLRHGAPAPVAAILVEWGARACWTSLGSRKRRTHHGTITAMPSTLTSVTGAERAKCLAPVLVRDAAAHGGHLPSRIMVPDDRESGLLSDFARVLRRATATARS